MKQLLLLIAISLFTSCAIYINDDGYRFLSNDEKIHVKVLDKSINDISNDGNLYKINISQMQDFLDSHEKVLVYEYLLYCKSDHCILPSAVENMCNKAGITPCFVLESYTGAFFISKIESPLLIVDAANYKKKKYYDQFFNELTNTTYKTRGYGRFYYFKKGKFIKCIDDILAEDLSILE